MNNYLIIYLILTAIYLVILLIRFDGIRNLPVKLIFSIIWPFSVIVELMHFIKK